MRYPVILILILTSFIDTFCQCEPVEISQFKSEIVARSSGNDLEEPLIPGEEVFVNISYRFISDTTGRYLHGLIPTFGSGWDIDKTNIETFIPKYGLHLSTWVSGDEDCPPYTTKDIPSLCTYVDDNGILQLCNLECETCPCSDGLKTDDELPSGWFWIFEPAWGSCQNFSECPLPISWGPWGVDLSHNGRDIKLDILLTVGNHSDIDSCETNKDLTIGIQELFDDIAGCWESDENRVSNKYFTENWDVDCTQDPINQKFNNLKVNVYHDENMDGIRGDSEEILNGFDDYSLNGDSVITYSQYLDYYLLAGNQYEIIYTVNDNEDWVLSTPESVELIYMQGVYDKEVEFGFFKQVTSIDENPSEKEIHIYPNPVKSSLSIDLPHENTLLKITNSKGVTVHQANVISRSQSIDMSKFSSGIYFISIYTNDFERISMQKIVKY